MSAVGQSGMAAAHFRAELRRLLDAKATTAGAPAFDVESIVRGDAVFVSARAGELLVDTTNVPDAVRFVVEGFVKIVCAVPGRRRPLIVRFVGPGEFVALPMHPGASRVGIAAHTDATLASFPTSRVRHAFGSGLCLDARWWVSGVRLAVDKTMLLGLPLAARLIHELRGLVPRFGRRQVDGWLLDLPLYHADVADLVAGSRSNVTRRLVSFVRDGVLDRVDRRFFLRDRFMTLDLGAPPPSPGAMRRALARDACGDRRGEPLSSASGRADRR